MCGLDGEWVITSNRQDASAIIVHVGRIQMLFLSMGEPRETLGCWRLPVGAILVGPDDTPIWEIMFTEEATTATWGVIPRRVVLALQ